jgi:hypothetical protein
MAVRVNIDLLTEFLLVAVLERKPLFGGNIRSGNDFNSVGGRMGVVSQRSAIAAADDAETDFFHVFMPCFKKIDNFFYKILAILQNSIYILCIMVKKDVFFRDKMRNIDILWI